MMLEKITAVGVASSERRRCAELNKVASRGLGITRMTTEQRPEAAKEVRRWDTVGKHCRPRDQRVQKPQAWSICGTARRRTTAYGCIII